MNNRNIFKICLLAVLGLASVVFTSCKDNESKPGGSTSKTTDAGVVINGVKWATRNVDAFGTFAETPESAGMFYQWNRKTAWSVKGSVSGWDGTTPTGTTWEKANDPSPSGWRVPTEEELETLCDTKKVSNEWTTQNGVTGRKFTDKATGNSLFLPSACFRTTYGNVAVCSMGSADYWSSTGNGGVLQFSEKYEAYMWHELRACGLCVRPVFAE